MRNVLFVLMLLSVIYFYGTTINVPGEYNTIQAGITASADGDTVLVQPGIYVENIDYDDKNILVTSLYHTTQDTSYISSTVIDGNQNGTVVTASDNESSDAILKGFTITNGYSSTNGGGIWIIHASLSLINVRVINNSCHAFGGGVCCHWATVSLIDSQVNDNITETAGGGGLLVNYTTINIENCEIAGNQELDGWGGGAIYSEEAEIHISNSLIMGNIAEHCGGAIYVNYSSLLEITDTEICDNEAGVYGGGICIYNVDTILNRVSMHHNAAEAGGGGIYLYEGNIILQNVTLADNSSLDGAAFGIEMGGNIAILNSIICDNPGNTAYYYEDGWIGAAYSDIEDYETYVFIEAVENVIDEDPMFLDDPECEYFLRVNSPCHDSGTDFFHFIHTYFDVELESNEYMGIMPDMGAYEYFEVNEENEDEIAKAGMKLSCYPNPFNPEMRICFDLDELQQVDLRIYNLRGELVKVLCEKALAAGEQNILWNGKDNKGNDVSSGIYLVSLTAGANKAGQKIALIK